VFGEKKGPEMDTEFDYEKYKDDPRLLTRFAGWYVGMAKKEKVFPIKTIYDNVSFQWTNEKSKAITGIVLYRQGDLQVQLWVCAPNVNIVEHRHPNVDSYEVYVGADLFFSRNGIPLKDESKIFPLEDGTSNTWMESARILPTTPHGGRTGKRGGTFLSIQHWKNGIPVSSVEKDWEGELMSETQEVTSGEKTNY